MASHLQLCCIPSQFWQVPEKCFKYIEKKYKTMQMLITLQDFDCENSVIMNAVYFETNRAIWSSKHECPYSYSSKIVQPSIRMDQLTDLQIKRYVTLPLFLQPEFRVSSFYIKNYFNYFIILFMYEWLLDTIFFVFLLLYIWNMLFCFKVYKQ